MIFHMIGMHAERSIISKRPLKALCDRYILNYVLEDYNAIVMNQIQCGLVGLVLLGHNKLF